MGREFASRETRTSDTADDESSRGRNGWGTDDYDEWEAPSGSGTPDLIGELSLAEAKRRYDRDFGLGVDEVYRLMRMEEAYGPKVHQWVDEGIPGEAMETAETRERFRERKDTPIPWDIEDDHEETLQRSLDAADDESPAGRTGVPDSVRDVISSPGRSLDPAIQRAVEERMDESFGDVRIHTGAKAAAAADEIDARAFTVGNHVAFGAGEYDPESVEGQHVLIHELAHVRQQTDGVVSLLPRGAEIDRDSVASVGDSSTDEDAPIRQSIDGGVVGVDTLAGSLVHVQRWEDQPRTDDGLFDEKDLDQFDEKRYGFDRRPEYAEGQVEAVWRRAERDAEDGVVRDPNTQRPLGTLDDHGDTWHMGHREDREYRYLVQYYLLDVISEAEFLAEYHDPDHYRPEDPKANMSGRFEGDGQHWERKWGKLERYKNE